MTSVRWTAYRWVVGVLAVVGLVSATVSYLAGRDEANFVFDGQLAQLAMLVGGDLQAAFPVTARPDPEDAFVVQVWDDQHRIRRVMGGVDIPRQSATGFTDLMVDDTPWRVFTVVDGGRTVQVSHRQKLRDDLAEHLALSAALPILAAIPLAWGFFVVGLGRLFRQLNLASTRLAERSGDSTELLPLDVAPGEVRPLITAMNTLLQRQRAAGEQQRQFVSDAAHELRTPLAAILILVDTLAERSRQGARVDDIVGELSLAAGRARSLCNQLLKLAELDARKDRTEATDVDLHSLLLEVVAGHVQAASRKGIELGLHAHAVLRVKAETTDLASLFSNLIDNAVRYSGDGGVVEVSMRMQDGAGLIEVVDSGSGIPAEALPRIFDRFFRAAVQEIEGTGLGLAIAKATADRYGFILSIANRSAGGVIARVVIPAEALLAA